MQESSQQTSRRSYLLKTQCCQFKISRDSLWHPQTIGPCSPSRNRRSLALMIGREYSPRIKQTSRGITMSSSSVKWSSLPATRPAATTAPQPISRQTNQVQITVLHLSLLPKVRESNRLFLSLLVTPTCSSTTAITTTTQAL